jgi:hypothetical protein
MKCNECGGHFDPADLSQVAIHIHKGITAPPIKGKKVITHARDVYPHCSGEFASGVHLYLSGEPIPERPCADALIQGWISAERDLKDNFVKTTQP